MAGTIRTELGEKSRTSKKLCPKNDFNIAGKFRKIRFDLVWSLWIDHAAIFNNFRQI